MYNVNILGVEYEIILQNHSENGAFNHCDGYADFTTKKIYVLKQNSLPVTDNLPRFNNLEYYENKVIRHEIIHAFLYESGLDYSTVEKWARNEEMVDFFAIQFPKINKVFSDINVII